MLLRRHVLVSLFLVASVLATPDVARANTITECSISGTESDDVLIGTDEDDVICGFGGDDLIIGGMGQDVLIGGAGADELQGGPGDDVLFGDDGTDALFGGTGTDVLRGGADDDRLTGGAGDDVLRGGNGGDDLAGGDGADTLWGGNGDDLLRGANGDDVLYGGVGGDVVRGGSGSDRLRGGPEDDVCIDTAARTNTIGCEYGIGGDQDPVRTGEVLWKLLGNDEFVYSVSSLPRCVSENAGEIDERCDGEPFIDTVHVRAGLATSAFGPPALTSSQLFEQANDAIAAGGDVIFDRATGLPRQIDGVFGDRLVVHEVSLRDALRSSLEHAAEIWSDRGETDYSYVATAECSCPDAGRVRVVVTDGEASASALDGSTIQWPGFVKTIDEHLADIADVLDGHAIAVSAKFEPSTGLPLSYAVDRDRALDGDEFSISISDFLVAQLPLDDEQPAEGDEDPADGVPQTLTIVSVGGIEVSSVIASDMQALLSSAADAGFMLSGGGFRDPQRQIELRKVNCGTTDFEIFDMPADQCSPPTARPGQSQHELGLAIDFTNAGRLITSNADPAFIWLAEHAATFGLFNLAAEPWHWSTTGN